MKRQSRDPVRAKVQKEVPLTPEEAVKEASRCIQCNEPNCMGGCPLGISVPTVLSLVSARKFKEAASLLRENNPAVSDRGRACLKERPCERSCTLSRKNSAVPICAIELLLLSH